MAQIPIAGVPSTFRVPGTYAAINFNQGPSNAAAGVRTINFVGAMLGSGTTYTANTRYEVTREQDVIDGAGQGSPLHRMVRAAIRANPRARMYVVPYAPSSGGTPATADLDMTVGFSTGSAPTGSGTLTLTISGEACEVAFNTSSTATTIAAAVVATVNARPWLPVTASNSSGVVTLAARIAGKSQGDGTVPVIRVHLEVTAGRNVTFETENSLTSDFLGNGTATAGADGSTTEAANFNTALGTLNAVRDYYLVTHLFLSTELGHLKTHVANKSEARPGLRSQGIAAYTGALAACQTLATGLNFERLQVVWMKNAEHEPGVLAAIVAAIRQKREEVDPVYNFDSYSEADWNVLPARAVADWPDDDDLDDAITDGITPIQSTDAGSFLVMSVNTRSKDAAGSVDDFRSTETHRVSGQDAWLDTTLIRHRLTFANKKLKSDEVLEDGVTVNPNQRIRPGVVTPSTFKPWLFRQIDDGEDRTILQRVSETKAGANVVVDPSNSGRLEVGLTTYTIDLLHQTTYRISEASSG